METADQTALFKQYETDYCNKSTDISRKIGGIPSLLGEQRRTKATEIEAEMRSADTVIKSMDMEARQLPQTIAAPLLGKVREYKADLASLREQLRAASIASPVGDAARAELGLASDYYSTTAGQREKMLTATQRLEKSSARLTDARQMLAQAEDTGASILVDLHGQRETIERSRTTLQSADEGITKARKTLSSMARHVMQNKIILYGIIAFLLLAIALIVYAKLLN
mmetsp:Transcript_6481/g.20160  ORF Transcript_6481/g.20160 Transcript_6481/m.20160 type:complete len:226 (-) Transcript_6481:327-1004(-)